MGNPKSSSEDSNLDSDEQLSANSESDVSAEYTTEEEDPDVPRISQWEPEDDLNTTLAPSTSHGALNNGEGSSKALVSSVHYLDIMKQRLIYTREI